MGFFKSVSNNARGLYGVWSQLRRIVRLLEWNLDHGLRLETPWGTFLLHGSLPPTKKEMEEAVKEPWAYSEVDEEMVATEKVLELIRKQSRGVSLDDDDPGKDFSLYE